jgi:hypothetical protein
MKTTLTTAVCYCASLITVGLLALMPMAVHAQAPADTQPIVTLGAETITRSDYIATLEAAVGRDILRKMVFSALVLQAAAKAGVMPTEADVDARVKDISIHQPALVSQVSTPAGRENLMTDIALENLRIQNVVVSDAEVANFYTRNAALFTLPSQVQTTLVVSQSQADADRAEILLGQDLTPEAIAAKPGLHVAGVNGFNFDMGSLPTDVRQKIGQTVLAMKSGEIKTLPIGSNFLTFKVKSAHTDQLLPLSQVKDEATRQTKLQRAASPQAELAKLYQANPPTFSDPKYKAYFTDIENYHSTP